MELKKNPKMDYRKKSGLFFNVGLVLSLLFVISAFEWKFERNDPVVAQGGVFFPGETVIVPPTVQPPPEKPVVRQFDVIKIVENEVDVPDLEIIIDIADDPIVEIIEPAEKLPDEEVEEIPYIVETMPSYVGGLEEFYKFVGKHLKYPAQARRMGIEGKVFVYFVVDQDGGLNDIKIARGIGAGCDEEVLRIINMSPKWNPGKQRGVPVKVRMMMPITFRLQ
jgi:protein TonB